MKFKVQMKDPDTLYDAIQDAVNAALLDDNHPDDEREALAEIRERKISGQCSKWFKYGEYLTVEIDTDADTCVVVAND